MTFLFFIVNWTFSMAHRAPFDNISGDIRYFQVCFFHDGPCQSSRLP